MKIADVEVINLHFTYPDQHGFQYAGGRVTARTTSLIVVTADDKTVGLGAAYSYPDIVRIIVEHHLRPHLIGRDPTQVEDLWNLMYGLTRWYGRKGAAMSALGGLDIAFWDLRGKAQGQPIYRLLGGERSTVPAYASGLFWTHDVAELEREAARHLANGFRRVKMRLGRSEVYDRAAVDAAQRGIGADGDVLVDGSHRYSLKPAERMGSFLADRKIFWFEEPFPPEDIDSYVALRSSLQIPLAAGENDFGVQGFREMLRAGAIDIAQPDVCRAGGITEVWRIGQLAAESGARIATHTWSDAVALIANAHVVAALPNGITVEVDQTGNPFIDRLLKEPLHIENGRLRLPDAAGLGIDLDPAAVTELTLPPGTLMPDGNYSDLIFGPQYLSEPPPYETIPAGG